MKNRTRKNLRERKESSVHGGGFAALLIYVLLFHSFIFYDANVQIPSHDGSVRQTLDLNDADKATDQMQYLLAETTPLSLINARITRNPTLTACCGFTIPMFTRMNHHFFTSVSAIHLMTSNCFVQAQKNCPLLI